MCGIFASFDRSKFIELGYKNAYRGSASCSVSHSDGKTVKVVRRVDRTFDQMEISGDSGVYKLGHIQAPTTIADLSASVHPAAVGTSMLWHNGIVKDFDVKRLQSELNTGEAWDTMLILKSLLATDGWGVLSGINGSFACVMVEDNTIFVFRNEISPLFVDDELNMSSVKFEGCRSLPANKVFMLDLEQRAFLEVGDFATKENPYFMTED